MNKKMEFLNVININKFIKDFSTINNIIYMLNNSSYLSFFSKEHYRKKDNCNSGEGVFTGN